MDAAGLASVFANRRAIDAQEYAALSPSDEAAGHSEALAAVSRYGAVILDRDGRPGVAIGVVSAGTPGGWLCWMIATDAWNECWRAAHRWVRNVLAPQLVSDPEVRRVSALVSATNAPAQRFMAAFGFEREGLHRCIGRDGSDWITYARVKG